MLPPLFPLCSSSVSPRPCVHSFLCFLPPHRHLLGFAFLCSPSPSCFHHFTSHQGHGLSSPSVFLPYHTTKPKSRSFHWSPCPQCHWRGLRTTQCPGPAGWRSLSSRHSSRAVLTCDSAPSSPYPDTFPLSTWRVASPAFSHTRLNVEASLRLFLPPHLPTFLTLLGGRVVPSHQRLNLPLTDLACFLTIF